MRALYGFAGYLGSFVAFGAYVVWALWWDTDAMMAVAIPTWAAVSILYGVLMYILINVRQQVDADAASSIVDESSESRRAVHTVDQWRRHSSELRDVDILLVSRVMPRHR